MVDRNDLEARLEILHGFIHNNALANCVKCGVSGEGLENVRKELHEKFPLRVVGKGLGEDAIEKAERALAQVS